MTPAPATPPVPDDDFPTILQWCEKLPKRCEFSRCEGALYTAIDQRETIAPALIAFLERVAANPAPWLEQREDCRTIIALYLLAHFRERRALDVFLRLFSLPDDQVFELTDADITETGSVLLASVCSGDPAPLLRLIHDETINGHVRSQAIQGLMVQGIWGERPREAVIADLRALYSSLAKPGNASVWAALVGTVADFNAPELLPQARQAFAEDLVDECSIALDDIDPDAPGMIPGLVLPVDLAENHQWFCDSHEPFDAVAACAGWACFSDEDDDLDWDDVSSWDKPLNTAPPLPSPPPDPVKYTIPTPYVAPPKVGRNAPCPCGSGKKHKKCCGK
ncbi:MAG TPA: DUF1186 domain-containing protein [Verrucomicrobiae bacterium]